MAFSSQKYLFSITTAVLGIGLLLWLSKPGIEAPDAPVSGAPIQDAGDPPPQESTFSGSTPSDTPLDPDHSLEEFVDWLSDYEGASPEKRRNEDLIKRGIRLAKIRFPLMRKLIHESPPTALSHALSFAEYDSLPQAIRAFVEKPFSTVAELDVFPRCDGVRVNRTANLATSQDVDIHLNAEFGSLDAFTSGWRLETPSRKNTPVQGIQLDGLAAVRSVVFQLLPESDIPTAEKLFPVGNPDPGRGFASGQPLPEKPLVALAGGRLFYFTNRENLENFESRAVKLEEMIGENLGANLIFEILATMEADPEAGFDMAAVEEQAKQEQSEAATAVRKAILIRIDFSDKTGSPIAVSTLQNRMDGEVNDQCRDMSFGAITLNNAVQSQLIRMPRPTTYYNGTDDGSKKNSALFNDAIAAAEAAGITTTGFAHRCIMFKGIGMGYCGLATVGGSKIWLPCHGSKVIVHELGHNFGVLHASFHDPNSDADPLGAGTSSEYGDNTDIMGGGGVSAGHFHPQFKTKLGWLESGQRYNFNSGNTNNTWRIYRFDHPDTDAANARRAIRVYRGTNGEYLWIGYRQRYSFQNYLKGAQLYWQKAGKSKSWLLDVSPGGGKNNSGLGVGRTFSDTRKNLHITALKRGGSNPDQWLEVQVRRGPFTGNGAPAITSLHIPNRVPVNQAMTYGVSANDPDGDALAYYFDFKDGNVIGNDGTSLARSYSFTSKGAKTVTLTISDRKGLTVSQNISVTVQDVLGKPGGLTTSNATAPGEIHLTWDSVAGATSYRVFRSDSNWAAQAIQVGTSSNTAYGDAAVEVGSTYYYWIQALGSGSSSQFSIAKAATPKVPAPQLDLTGASRVGISWDSYSAVDRYEIFRGATSDSAEATQLGESTSAAFDDTTPEQGRLYYWFVRSVIGTEVSDFSAPASGRRIFDSPSGLTTEQTATNEISMSWSPASGGLANGFEISRSPNPDPAGAQSVYLGDLNTTSWVDPSALKGDPNYYRVRAVSDTTTGEWSSPVPGYRLLETFAEFANRHQLGDPAAARYTDHDQDGASAFEEWAQGLSDPTSGISIPKQIPKIQEINGEDFFTISFLRLLGTEESVASFRHRSVIYRVQAGIKPNLLNQIPIAVEPPADLEAPPRGYEWGCFCYPAKVAEADGAFLRFSVQPVN